jgi:hypothetical protein
MCPICLIRVVHTPPYFEVGSLHPTSRITLLSVWWFFSLHRIWCQIFIMAIFCNLTHHPGKLPIQTMQITISSDLTTRKNWSNTSFIWCGISDWISKPSLPGTDRCPDFTCSLQTQSVQFFSSFPCKKICMQLDHVWRTPWLWKIWYKACASLSTRDSEVRSATGWQLRNRTFTILD